MRNQSEDLAGQTEYSNAAVEVPGIPGGPVQTSGLIILREDNFCYELYALWYFGLPPGNWDDQLQDEANKIIFGQRSGILSPSHTPCRLGEFDFTSLWSLADSGLRAAEEDFPDSPATTLSEENLTG